MNDSILSIIRFGAALLGALLVGFVSLLVFISFSDCGWLGPFFNAGCKKGIGSVFLLAFLVFGASLVLFLRLAFQHKQTSSSSSSSDRTPPSGLYWSWVALLCLQYAAPVLNAFVSGGLMYLLVGSLLISVAFIVASALLARYRARHPATSLLALVPYVGPLIVGALLFKPKQSVVSGGTST